MVHFSAWCFRLYDLNYFWPRVDVGYYLLWIVNCFWSNFWAIISFNKYLFYILTVYSNLAQHAEFNKDNYCEIRNLLATLWSNARKTRATRASPCLLPSAQRATEKQQCKWRYQSSAVLEKTDLVSFQARDDWDFTFNMIKIKKWCSWRKGKEKDKKGRK